jgi:glycine/D-amino acid oxidase-like deaminating enzyme/nitrite reductase/ring-hydroxylating ferredoxin subunit
MQPAIWRPPARPSRPHLARDLEVDVAIVGAGLTGLALGLHLARGGLSVAILERRHVGSGATGATTAHVTTALDVGYDTLTSRFGEQSAGIVADSVRRAVDEIESLAHGEPKCAFERVPGFRFAEKQGEVEALESEVESARRLGVDVELDRGATLPFVHEGALRFERQAQLDPLAYLALLTDAFLAAGGQLYEESPVTQMGDGRAVVRGGPCARARFVVDATHTPVGLVATVQTRLAAMTSYVLAARLERPLPLGLYWDCAEPYHYVRALEKGSDVAIVGGEDHATGREDDPAARQRALEAWTRSRLPVREIVVGWSHEVFEPSDGLPYIGAVPGDASRLVAAGYSGTGWVFGTVAARLLGDLIVDGRSEWQEVYSPRRLPVHGAPRLLSETIHVARHFLGDRLGAPRGRSEGELARECGRVERHGTHLVAVYRDAAGALHRLSPRCTHLGCIVHWNDFEKTWDCPCHGGRFEPTGRVVYGPPAADLAPSED